MDQKIKINWAISYLLLWEFFLIAHHKPEFSNSFVRNHSKNAVKIHLMFLGVILIYKYFIQGFINISITLLNNITIAMILESIIYLYFTFLILKSSYRAFCWIEAKEININKDYLKLEEQVITGELTETQNMIYVSSYIPFVWLIISWRFNTPINNYWAKISWIFSIILVFFVITNHSDLMLVALFLYISFVVYAWIMMGVNKKVIFSNFLNSIPNLSQAYLQSRVLIVYLIESIKVIFNKKDEISFESIKNNLIEKDRKFNELAKSYLSSESLFISNKLIYIPLINIIFIPKYLFDKKSKYTIAIAQAIIITVILILAFVFFPGVYMIYWPIFLFPIFLWIANIDSNPFYRIPFLYEIYVIIDKLTFWVFSKIKFLKEKKNEVQELSFKV